jgi:hypothetical protein
MDFESISSSATAAPVDSFKATQYSWVHSSGRASMHRYSRDCGHVRTTASLVLTCGDMFKGPHCIQCPYVSTLSYIAYSIKLQC